MAIKAAYEIEASDITEKIKNLLFNGGFDSILDTPTSIADIADEADTPFHSWIFNKGGTSDPTVTITEETTTKKTNSARSCEIQITGAGSGTPICGVKQEISNWAEYKGKKISLRACGYASNASKLRAYIDDGVAKTYSSYHSGGGTWENLDVEDFTADNNTTKMEIGIEIVADDTFTIYVDNLMLIPGDTSVDMVMYRDTGFFNRGDPSSLDWEETDLTLDNAWHDLDCSGVVPIGAKAILFYVRIKDGIVEKTFFMKKNGNSNDININQMRTQVVDISIDNTFTVPCDNNQVVEYKSNTGIDIIDICIIGWLM